MICLLLFLCCCCFFLFIMIFFFHFFSFAFIFRVFFLLAHLQWDGTYNMKDSFVCCLWGTIIVSVLEVLLWIAAKILTSECSGIFWGMGMSWCSSFPCILRGCFLSCHNGFLFVKRFLLSKLFWKRLLKLLGLFWYLKLMFDFL